MLALHPLVVNAPHVYAQKDAVDGALSQASLGPIPRLLPPVSSGHVRVRGPDGQAVGEEPVKRVPSGQTAYPSEPV